jgi:hypothetical protein
MQLLIALDELRQVGRVANALNNLPAASASIAMGLRETVLYQGETIAVVCAAERPLSERASLTPGFCRPPH